jgi:hypothetical protein
MHMTTLESQCNALIQCGRMHYTNGCRKKVSVLVNTELLQTCERAGIFKRESKATGVPDMSTWVMEQMYRALEQKQKADVHQKQSTPGISECGPASGVIIMR